MKKILILLFSAPLFAWTLTTPTMKGWDTRTITFSLNTQNCVLSDAEMISIVDEAIAAWNGIPMADITLARGTSSTSVATTLARTATDMPVIVCDPAFGTHEGPGAPDPDFVIGYAMGASQNSAGHITYTSVVLNSNATEDAAISNLSRAEVVVVLAHEIGHALGLGHSQDPDALMYYSVNKDTPTITEDDMDGMAFLYPRNEFSGKPLGCSAVHQKNTTVPVEWMTFSAILTILTSFGAILFGRKFLRPEPLL